MAATTAKQEIDAVLARLSAVVWPNGPAVEPTFPANKSSARSNRKFHASSRSLSTAVGTISNSITSTVQPLPQSSGEILFELVVTMQKFWPPRMERRQLTTLLDVFERVQTEVEVGGALAILLSAHDFYTYSSDKERMQKWIQSLLRRLPGSEYATTVATILYPFVRRGTNSVDTATVLGSCKSLLSGVFCSAWLLNGLQLVPDTCLDGVHEAIVTAIPVEMLARRVCDLRVPPTTVNNLLIHLLTHIETWKNDANIGTFLKQSRIRCTRDPRIGSSPVIDTTAFTLVHAYLQRFIAHTSHSTKIAERELIASPDIESMPHFALRAYYALSYNQMTIEAYLRGPEMYPTGPEVYSSDFLARLPYAGIVRFLAGRQNNVREVLPMFMRLMIAEVPFVRPTALTAGDEPMPTDAEVLAVLHALKGASAQYDIAAHLKQWRLYFRERPMECVGITTRVLFGFHGGLVTLDPMTLLRINESHLSTDGLLEIFLDVLSFCVDYCRAKIQRHMMLKTDIEPHTRMAQIESSTLLLESTTIQQLLKLVDPSPGIHVHSPVGEFVQQRLELERVLLTKLLCFQTIPDNWCAALVRHVPAMEAMIPFIPDVLAAVEGRRRLDAVLLACHLVARYRKVSSHAMLRDILEPRLKQYQADVASFPLRTQSRILRSVDVDVATVEDIQMLSSVGARAVAAFESPTEI